MARTLPLPGAVLRRLDAVAAALLRPDGVAPPDLSRPAGEPGLFAPDSVTWRIFANPLALLTGGVAAVLLELAHPAVRAGVWTHSRFRTDPVERIRRTGHAAMISVYGPRSAVLPLVARIARRHQGVHGNTDDGRPYHASDPELLAWVHATAVHGFATAYDRYVIPLEAEGLSRAFAEAAPLGRLHGVPEPPGSIAAWRALVERTAPILEPSPVIDEFLAIMHAAPLLPGPLRALQAPVLRGAVDLVPEALRAPLDLGRHELRRGDRALLRGVGALAERVRLPSHPASQAAARMRPVGGGTATPAVIEPRHD